MDAADAVHEPDGALLLAGLCLLAALATIGALIPAIVALVRSVLASPPVWPVLGGIAAFWALCASGRPIAGMLAALAGVIGTAVVQDVRDRAVRRARAVDATTDAPPQSG